MGSLRKLGNTITGRSQEKAYSQASKTQSDSTKYAADLAYKQFQENKASLAPWTSTGTTAVNNLAAAMNPGGSLYDTSFTAEDFEEYKDPGYDWRVQQGQDALASQAAATGNYGSGNMATALIDYGQNAASQEYQNAYNRWNNSQNALYDRLYNLSSLGANATSGVANMGTQSALMQGDYATQGANALASGMIGGATARSNALNNLRNQISMAAGMMG